MVRRRSLLAVLATAAFGLAGCDTMRDFFDSAPKTKLAGTRLSVLTLDTRREPDPALAQLEVKLPPPVENAAWPEAGGAPAHVMQHLSLGPKVTQSWRSGIGDGASRYGRVTAQPVIADGHIFAMDAADVVTAYDAAGGRRLWSFDPKPDEARSNTFGGGLALAGGRLFVATGYGQVLALDPATGKPLWRQNVSAPVHGAPTVADGRVFAITVENQLEALAADDGHRLWTHNGIPETAGLLGGVAPAVEGDVVVVPYSSGELFALRVENGRALWSDNLATAQPLGALATLADINGLPVIDRDRVFAVSHSGRMVAIDLRTGDRVWEQDIGSTQTPWVAGDFVYVLSNDANLLCLTRQDGRVRWAHELPRWENPDKKSDPIRWAGPVLAGDRLVVVASNGTSVAISPYTGEELGKSDLPDGVFVSPIVAANTLYVLTDEADLIALR